MKALPRTEESVLRYGRPLHYFLATNKATVRDRRYTDVISRLRFHLIASAGLSTFLNALASFSPADRCLFCLRDGPFRFGTDPGSWFGTD